MPKTDRVKTGWKKVDKKYRLEQNAKAKANRDRKAKASLDEAGMADA